MDNGTLASQFIVTEDGSPTLSLCYGDKSEAMHNSKGAFSETLYVYGEPIARTLRGPSEQTRFLSVGLGLGYVEMNIAASWLSLEQDVLRKPCVEIESFESSAALRGGFVSWLSQSCADTHACYDDIARLFERHFRLSPGSVKDLLSDWLSTSKLQLRGALESAEQPSSHSDCILFDAFSRAMTPALWQHEFLLKFVLHCAAQRCLFASYAATGDLRRALKAAGFRFEERAGYGGKRECTLAYRNS